MTGQRLLGVDIGSSAVKAAVFGGDGRQLAVNSVDCPSPGEFDPARWWDAAAAAMRGLDLSGVAAAGVCGRGGTNVLLDSGGRVIAPSWSDRRASAEHGELRERYPDIAGHSLNLLAEARWWERNHGPVAVAFTAKDYVNFLLAGSIAGDPASGAASEPGMEPLAPVRMPWERAGLVTAEAAALTGLNEGTPVAAGWHDGAAATFGAGASQAGTAVITLGTSAVYRVVTANIPEGLPRYWDLTPGLGVSGGDIPAAGRAMAWARALWPGARMEGSQPGANGLTFLPQFVGRIAPGVNREARAAFHELDGSQSAADMVRAVGEGIAYSLRQVRDHLAAGGLTAERTVATGGGAHDPVQAQIVADVLGEPVTVAQVEEGCRGAALLGAVAAGAMSLEAARTLAPQHIEYRPDAATRPPYDAAYDRFLAVQAALDTVNG